MTQENGRSDHPVITFSLAISHTPWIEERVRSVHRLLEELGVLAYEDEDPDTGSLIAHGLTCPDAIDVRLVSDRAPNDQWSERMWKRSAETDATHCLFLQDDVEVAPRFWAALRAIVETRPDDIIGLEVAHPIARPLAGEDVRLFTTADMLVGPGYVIPRDVLVEFLIWRAEKLRDGWRTAAGGKPAITEDTMIGVFALTTGRRIVHPIPTIIDHDTSIPSTYGNDWHTNRRPHVTWKHAAAHEHAWDDECTDLEGPGFWQGRFKRIPVRAPDGTPLGYQRATNTDPAVIAAGARVPHVGRFYDATPEIARRWVDGFGEREYRAARADRGDREKRRLMHARAAQHVGGEAKARILVCTPTRGGVHPEYSASMLQLVQLVQLDFEHGIEILDSWQWHEDVVRVRSRFVRAALETDATHVHFRDSDVGAHPVALLGMLAADRGIVAAPYPRRDSITWPRLEAAARQGARPLEAFAYAYPIGLRGGSIDADASECAEVDWMPLGFSLLRRDALERMVDHYDALDRDRVDMEYLRVECVEQNYGDVTCNRKEIARALDELARWRKGAMGLRYVDQIDGRDVETVGLFQLMTRASDRSDLARMWGEDQSFCFRARDIGIPVWCYLGRGSPVDHYGEHRYRGHLEALGLTRANGAPVADTERPPPPATPEAFALDSPEDPAREPEEPAVP